MFRRRKRRRACVAPAGTVLDGVEKLAGAAGADGSGRVTTSGARRMRPAGVRGKYLVDDSGAAVYLVDPGINGEFKKRPDGTEARKYPAPKAVLMSDIIEGLLGGKLPWGLVMFGDHDFGGAGIVGHPFAGIRGGGLSADFVVHAAAGRGDWCAGWWTAGSGAGRGRRG